MIIYIYESQSFVHICAGYSCWKLMSPLCGTTCVLRPWWHFGILMHLRWTESKAFLEGWGKCEGNQTQFKHIREQEGASEFQPNPALSLFDAAQFEADVWELRHKAIRHSEAVLELRVLAQATGEACCAAAGFDMISDWFGRFESWRHLDLKGWTVC